MPAESGSDEGTAGVQFSRQARELAFVEVFCGVARLSASVKAVGLKTVAIDHERHPEADHKVTEYELTSAEDQSLFQQIIDKANVAAARFAPPCGTASRRGSGLCRPTCRTSAPPPR